MQTGLQQVDDGLAQLYGGIGQLPAKAKPLHDGIAKLQAGIGSVKDPASLAGGIDTIRGKIAEAVKAGSSLDQLQGGVDCLEQASRRPRAHGQDRGIDDGLARRRRHRPARGRRQGRREQRRALVACKTILGQGR